MNRIPNSVQVAAVRTGLGVGLRALPIGGIDECARERTTGIETMYLRLSQPVDLVMVFRMKK